jgi:hypothetical protein
MPSTSRSLGSIVQPAIGVFVAALIGAGCVASSGAASPSVSAVPSAVASDSPSASADPSPSIAVDGFYLRAYRTQALAPEYTFGWLPVTTIADGHYLTGSVAVSLIYPGPIYVGPASRPISAAGIAAVIDEARKAGLLGQTKEFGDDPKPGAMLCHLNIRLGGQVADLTGSCPDGQISGTPAAGTAQAFGAFWNKVEGLDQWLGAELGKSEQFAPTRMAVLIAEPSAETSGITPTEKAWPLASTFAETGVAYGAGMRCVTVSGADLATLLPVIKSSNQLTRFIDSTGAKASLRVRPLVPGEPDVC